MNLDGSVAMLEYLCKSKGILVLQYVTRSATVETDRCDYQNSEQHYSIHVYHTAEGGSQYYNIKYRIGQR